MSIRRDDLDAGKVDLSDVIDARRVPMKPVPPGDFLRMEFLKPMKRSGYRLAKDINVPLNRIIGILAVKRAITADRLADGSTTASAAARRKCRGGSRWR